MRTASAATLFLSLLFTGCALRTTAVPVTSQGVSLQGLVRGGQSPISGAHIYLFAANTTGYGNASGSLLNAASTGLSDSIGAYVTTDSTGAFSITGGYSCTANSQIYLYALGGNPGAGTNNSAAGLLAVLGNCPASGSFLPALPLIQIDEATTVAAAYALAGFAVDATHVSSSTTVLSQKGMANAFANAANIASIVTGQALATIPAGNGTIGQTKINTLANILSSCVNSTGPASSTCSTLFSNAQSGGSSGTVPTDTATAAINIAHNPNNAIATLFALQAAAATQFLPDLATAPNYFNLAIVFTGGGVDYPKGIAIDGSGNAWISNSDNNSVTEISSSGAFLSGASGYTGGGMNTPWGIAIDPSGSAWVTNSVGNSVTVLSSAGSILSGTSGITGSNLRGPEAIAIDGSGNAWVINGGNNSFTEISATGSILIGGGYYTDGGLGGPAGIAIDGSGNVWITNTDNKTVTKLSNTGSILSGGGYTNGELDDPWSIAIDRYGDAWVTNVGNNSVVALTSSGGLLSEFSSNMISGTSLAIDGSSNLWIANEGYSVTEFSPAGYLLAAGGGLVQPNSVAIDGSGNVWAANGYDTITEIIGAAAPVITPLSVGVNFGLGTRP